jgi:hypothetical protein
MWRDLAPPVLEDAPRDLGVSVVVESAGGAPGAQADTLEALGRQTYPESQIEVIEPESGDEPTGDVVVFVEAGAVPSREFVAAHARWHAAAADAVSLGPVRRGRDEDDPFDLILDLTRSFTDSADGLIVGAALGSLGVRRGTLLAVGGRGDGTLSLRRLDLAQRLRSYGAVFAPEPAGEARIADGTASAELARAVTEAATGKARLEVRYPEAASIVALPPFRAVASSRRYSRPAVVVNVDAAGAGAADVAATVAPLLDGVLGDLELRLQVPEDHAERAELERLVGGDSRARVAASSLTERCDSPFQMTVPAAALPDPRTLADLHRLAIGEDTGAMHVTVPGAPPQDVMIEVVASGAWARAGRVAQRSGEDVAVVVGRLFGERWVSGVEVNVRAHGVDEPHVTEHGPLAAATDPKRERMQHLRFRSRADELERAAHALADRVIAERLRARRERLYADRLETRLGRSRDDRA